MSENKTKHLLVSNELDNLKTFHSSYVRGKIHFEEDGVQHYLIFQPIIRYFQVNTIISFTDYVLSWKSKGLSAETIKPPTTSDHSLTPTINYYYYASKIRIKFSGSCLKQPKISYTHGKVIDILIFYEFGASGSNNSNSTLKHRLLGAANLTKNAHIDKYGYSRYGIWFDRRSSFSFPGPGFSQNVLIWGGWREFCYSYW